MLERSGIARARAAGPSESRSARDACRGFRAQPRRSYTWRYEVAQHRGHIVPHSNPAGRTTAAVTETGADAPRARHVRGAARRAAAAPREVTAGDGHDQKFS